MKKKILGLGFILAMCSNVNAQAVEEGNFIVDGYVSGHVARTVFELAGISDSLTNYKHIGLPIGYGGKFEYMMSEKLGMGLAGNFVKTGYEYGNTGSITQYTRTKLRINLIFNYHVIQNEKFDAYLGWGLGYKNTVRTFTQEGHLQLN